MEETPCDGEAGTIVELPQAQYQSYQRLQEAWHVPSLQRCPGQSLEMFCFGFQPPELGKKQILLLEPIHVVALCDGSSRK